MQFFKKNKILTVFLVLLSFYLYNNYTRLVDRNLLVDKNSVQYVNNLYMSDGRIYNNYLNNFQKKLYLDYLNSVKSRKKELVFSLVDYGCQTYQEAFSILNIVHDAMLVDHPELMSYSGYRASYDSTSKKITVTFQYAIVFSFLEPLGEARIARIIDDIKNVTKDMTDVEKVKYVYEWIGTNNNYDRLFTYDNKNQSIYNVFIKKEAVCAGFSKASQVIFQNIGIESFPVTGYSTGPHMWNIIKLDGKYYFFDSTVSASYEKKEHKNFYMGLEQSYLTKFSLDHTNWYPFEIGREEFVKSSLFPN